MSFDGYEANFVEVVESELQAARADLAAQVDRVDALVDVLHLTYRRAAELEVSAVTLDDLVDRAEDEEERARLVGLLDRVIREKS